MSLDKTAVQPRCVPQIPIEPPEERDGREHTNLLLMLASLYVYRFANDLLLLRHSEPIAEMYSPPVEWMGTAVRDAALQVYHFGWALRGIGTTVKGCPILRAQIDHGRLRDAGRAFRRDFPDAALLRHAVSHLGEQLSTPEKIAELHRPGYALMWETTVGGSFSMASNHGKQVRLDVHERTLTQLRIVLGMTYDAFERADPTWLRAYG